MERKEKKKKKGQNYDEWLRKKKSKENQITNQKRRSLAMREQRIIGE